jgi:hypothetical protein
VRGLGGIGHVKRALLAGALVALLAAPAALAKTRPFTGHFTEASEFSLDPANCVGLRNNLVGSGPTSVFGPTTATGHACVSVDVAHAGVQVSDGDIVMKGARPDEIHVHYEARGGPPDASGTFHLTGIFQFVGGTGRYANARGGGTLQAVAGATTDSEIDLTGFLILPRSARHHRQK